jgi:uncharacterized protein YndB with AHSA1/START domain
MSHSFFLLTRGPKALEHRIHIAAAPDLVWRVTVEVERWPEWTPTVKSVARVGGAPLGVGSVVRIRQPGQPEAAWVVTAYEPRRRFAWETRRRGLRLVATHELLPEAGGTINVLRLQATGPLAVLLWPVLGFALRLALSRENVGLKQRCEQGVGHPAGR